MERERAVKRRAILEASRDRSAQTRERERERGPSMFRWPVGKNRSSLMVV